MNIPATQIEFKRKVGKSKGRDIYHVKTRGGLHVMALDGGRVLGYGPHRAVAKDIAQKMEEDLEWTELSKSDHVEREAYEHLLPKYTELTVRMRALQDEAKGK